MTATVAKFEPPHPAIAHIVDRLRELPVVERCILFGSRARGDHDRRADIDLAIACPAASPAEWARIWSMVDDAPTLLAIDLVRLEEASEPLRLEIEREGRTLYERRQT
ncbi:MAG TPA: nucleotidyltransferase domain-containing protein [Geminicoccaceae bacterium]